jgi:hypothetical protein
MKALSPICALPQAYQRNHLSETRIDFLVVENHALSMATSNAHGVGAYCDFLHRCWVSPEFRERYLRLQRGTLLLSTAGLRTWNGARHVREWAVAVRSAAISSGGYYDVARDPQNPSRAIVWN